MYVILYRRKAKDAPWRIVPEALYITRDRALYDAMNFGVHNEDKVYQVFRLKELKGQ